MSDDPERTPNWFEPQTDLDREPESSGVLFDILFVLAIILITSGIILAR